MKGHIIIRLVLCAFLTVLPTIYGSKSVCDHYEPRKPKHPKIFQVCDEKGVALCECSETTINCNNEHLGSVNIVAFPRSRKVDYITLRGNDIQAIFADQLLPGQTKNLEIIDLSHNYLCYIEDGAFRNMNKLIELDLSYNDLASLQTETFGMLYFLTELRLQNNKLKNLTGPIFEELEMLEFLYLDNNPVEHFDKYTFTGLDHLKELTLDNTSLSYLKEEWFIGLSRLETLTLRKNKFLVVPGLHHLTSLQTLDLSHNPFFDIPKHAFEGLTRLTHLIVSHMPNLWVVEDCAFCGLHRLQELQLFNSSRLTRVDPEAFGQRHYFKQKIDVIDLEGCALETLYSGLLPWDNVVSLKLGNNPWKCDCLLAWVVDHKLKLQSTFPKCASPSKFRNRYVGNVPKSELCGDLPLKISPATRNVLFGAMWMLLIAIIVGLFIWLGAFYRRRGFGFRNLFYRPQMPKYAYRNLVMSTEADETAPDEPNHDRFDPPPVDL